MSISPSKCHPDDARVGDEARQGAFGVEPSCGLPVPLPHLEAGERARRGSGQSLDLQTGEGTIVDSVIKAISADGGVAWQIGGLVSLVQKPCVMVIDEEMTRFQRQLFKF